MKRIVGLCVVGALLLAPVTSSAASRCDTRLLVWSGTVAAVTGVTPGIGCVSNATTNYDTRTIVGDHIMVTLEGPYLKGRPFVLATMNGLGWRRELTVLAWHAKDKRYKSAFMPIEHGLTATGCLTVSLTVTERRGRRTVKALSESTRYHTPGVRC